MLVLGNAPSYLLTTSGCRKLLYLGSLHEKNDPDVDGQYPYVPCWSYAQLFLKCAHFQNCKQS